jgi:hypothetical protein
MRWAAPQVAVKLVGHTAKPAYSEQLRLELLAEDASTERIGGASISSAPQGAVNVDRAAGYNLGTGANRAHDDEIAFLEANYLPGPDRPVHQHNRRVPSDRFPVNAQFTLGGRRSCLKRGDQPDELGPCQSL